MLLSPPTSPTRATTAMSPRSGASPLPMQRTASPTSPVFRPTHTLGSGRLSIDRTVTPVANGFNGATKGSANGTQDDEDWEPPVVNNTPSHLGRSAGGLPRTLALDSTMTGHGRAESPGKEPPSPVRVVHTSTGEDVTAQGKTIIGGHMTMTVPLTPRASGTRYGAALGGRTASPMTPTATGRSWGGGGNPSCGKCGKTVYFAEQVSMMSIMCKHESLNRLVGQGYRKDIPQKLSAVHRMWHSARLIASNGKRGQSLL